MFTIKKQPKILKLKIPQARVIYLFIYLFVLNFKNRQPTIPEMLSH